MHDFRKLDIWKNAISLADKVHLITKTYPKDELYSIVSQMRRCSISIASNIPEGCSRSSSKDFARFLEISLGSSYELETQLTISKNLNYISEIVFIEMLEIIILEQRMISKLRANLLI